MSHSSFSVVVIPDGGSSMLSSRLKIAAKSHPGWTRNSRKYWRRRCWSKASCESTCRDLQIWQPCTSMSCSKTLHFCHEWCSEELVFMQIAFSVSHIFTITLKGPFPAVSINQSMNRIYENIAISIVQNLTRFVVRTFVVKFRTKRIQANSNESK